MSEGLKPCPFCGKHPHVHYESPEDYSPPNDWYAITCNDSNCPGGCTCDYEKLNDAIKAWNRRTYE